ncbi:Bgt-51782 [Blumeria graminis f. sp. tritici]|uniref:Bgt-51782 n=1 Tax=Blumeria graminis f. sp. tritici TaxID=62690 RepID=A0A9X9L7Q9_BLUGR|nr:Bgt-51782 [Blumeria graminis f. sp. tritici]
MESMNSMSQAIHQLLKDNNLIHRQDFSDLVLA